MTPSTSVLDPTGPPTRPPRTVTTAVDAPQPRRCAVDGCQTTVDLWSWPGGPICRRHLLEHDAAAYGQDAVDRRRTEAK